MNLNINKKSIDKYLFLSLSFFLLILYFYNLYLKDIIPPTGDELNAILVYTSSIKTLFIKNYPNNVTLFHLIGYLKTILLGYDITTYRSINFIFILLHLLIARKMGLSFVQILLFASIILMTTFSLQNGLYIGYTFSSFIFCLIFFLLKENTKNKYSKIIFFLLFVQVYNHLVNLYLVIPLIFILFLSMEKKVFTKNFFIYFITPTSFLYLFSIVLTGIALLKIPQTDIIFVINFFVNNMLNILTTGFKGIFFYKTYAVAEKFNFISFINTLYQFDKIILLTLILSLLTSILSFKFYKNSYIYLIILFHFLTFIIINKDPSPRIFGGFLAFYLLIIFDYFKNFKISFFSNNFFTKYIVLLIPFILIINMDFSEKINISSYGRDITYKPNQLSKNILENSCILRNYNFSEIEKKNFYFNYLNFCNKKFSLSEFLIFYRSK
jgi:hypothetical protein